MSPILKIDHIGIAVCGLDRSLKFYKDVLGLRLAFRERVEAEGVLVAMLAAASGEIDGRIELLESSESGSVIDRFVEKNGPGLHHIAFEVESLESTLELIQSQGYRIVGGIKLGADHRLCAFVHPQSTGGVLIELVQKIS